MARGVAIFLGILVLLALTAELYTRARQSSHGRRMEVAAEHALLGGGLQGLLRARSLALGGSAVGGDPEASATLALSNAMLTSEYGLNEGNSALLAADVVEAVRGASDRAQALKLAARALVEVVKGRPDQAEALARRSVAMGHKQASPLFALGRVRFRQGDLPAAAHAFQAALVREPALVEARVAWAEVLLEMGERSRAEEALVAALRRTPDHSRAQLLMLQIEGFPSGASGAIEGWGHACERDAQTSPFVASICDLARAFTAWRGHDKDEAVRLAFSAARYAPTEPRVLGIAVQLLASAGAVDKAASCLEAVGATGKSALPSLRWARLSIELGRGQMVVLPKDLSPRSSPWAPLLSARVALASGGMKALEALGAVERDGFDSPTAVEALAGADSTTVSQPVSAYVKGMEARLSGKPGVAADLLARALWGHGDACRAAGEYLAACGAVGRVPDAAGFRWLQAENAHCVNLPAAFAAAREKPGTSGKRATRETQ